MIKKKKSNKNLPVYILLLFILFSCKTSPDKKTESKILHGKYPGKYSDNLYSNEYFNLSISFDNNWFIKSDYLHFDKFEKDFADYFNTEKSELLLIGYNDEIKSGVRLTVDRTGRSDEKYLESLKTAANRIIYKFNPEYLKEDEIYLENFMALHAVMKAVINKNNIFIYDSLIFRIKDYNFKLDFWINEENYEKNEEYFRGIYDLIIFSELPEKISDGDENDKESASGYDKKLLD